MFLILTATTLDDGTKAHNLATADTLEGVGGAYMQLHQTQAYNYANEHVMVGLVQVINENGTPCKTDYFNRTPEQQGTEPAAGE